MFFKAYPQLKGISIHAAREGGDRACRQRHCRHLRISIHAAREGGDDLGNMLLGRRFVFQSTPPVKAATLELSQSNSGIGISIHAAREGGDLDLDRARELYQISIHAAREGGDGFAGFGRHVNGVFQSTPPVKAATIGRICLPRDVRISIHAAREGGDRKRN